MKRFLTAFFVIAACSPAFAKLNGRASSLMVADGVNAAAVENELKFFFGAKEIELEYYQITADTWINNKRAISFDLTRQNNAKYSVLCDVVPQRAQKEFKLSHCKLFDFDPIWGILSGMRKGGKPLPAIPLQSVFFEN